MKYPTIIITDKDVTYKPINVFYEDLISEGLVGNYNYIIVKLNGNSDISIESRSCNKSILKLTEDYIALSGIMTRANQIKEFDKKSNLKKSRYREFIKSSSEYYNITESFFEEIIEQDYKILFPLDIKLMRPLNELLNQKKKEILFKVISDKLFYELQDTILHFLKYHYITHQIGIEQPNVFLNKGYNSKIDYDYNKILDILEIKEGDSVSTFLFGHKIYENPKVCSLLGLLNKDEDLLKLCLVKASEITDNQNYFYKSGNFMNHEYVRRNR